MKMNFLQIKIKNCDTDILSSNKFYEIMIHTALKKLIIFFIFLSKIDIETFKKLKAEIRKESKPIFTRHLL